LKRITDMDARRVEINWHPNLSVYASEPFLKAVSDDFGWLGGFDDAGRMRCIVRKGFLRLARFRVETQATEGGISVDDEKQFLNAVLRYLAAARADMVIPATTNTLFRTYPDGAIAAPYGSYVLDLTQPEGALWQSLSASHRRKIRLATKSGVEIKTGPEHWRTAYVSVRDTFQRSKMGFMSQLQFKRFVESLGDNAKILVAVHEGAVQASIVVPHSLHAAYYAYGGSIANPVTGATNLLHWEAIRMFQAARVKRYDFVGVRIRPERGSKQEGLMQFKERFGGRLIEGYMWKYHFHPLRSAAYSLAIHFSRGGDIVDHERHKLHSL
jgi:hypothetical protein